MYFCILVLGYYLLCTYIFFRFCSWSSIRFRNKKIIKQLIAVGIIWYITTSMLMVSFYLPTGSTLQRYLNNFSNTLMGVIILMITCLIIIEIIRVILLILFKQKAKNFMRNTLVLHTVLALVICISVGSVGYGLYHAKQIKDTYYSIDIDKSCTLTKTQSGSKNSMRIVLVADQHLGYAMGVKDIEAMVSHINNMKPDLVCFAGDFFDNHFENLDDVDGIKNSLKSINSTYGTYACMGNHDVNEKLLSGFSTASYKRAFQDPRFVSFLEDSNVKVLQDEVTLIDNAFYIIGQKDYEKPGDGTKDRADLSTLISGLDTSKPIIDINHEPRNLHSVAKEGVDIHLSGHTHDGQFFPISLSCAVVWENPTGCEEVEKNKYSIVTSGLGVYGPAIRIGTDSEVVAIDVKFKE